MCLWDTKGNGFTQAVCAQNRQNPSQDNKLLFLEIQKLGSCFFPIWGLTLSECSGALFQGCTQSLETTHWKWMGATGQQGRFY